MSTDSFSSFTVLENQQGDDCSSDMVESIGNITQQVSEIEFLPRLSPYLGSTSTLYRDSSTNIAIDNADVVEACITEETQSSLETAVGMIPVLLIFTLICYAIFATLVLLNYVNIQGISSSELLTMVRRIGVVLLHVSAYFTVMTLSYFVGKKVDEVERQRNVDLLLMDKIKLLKQEKEEFYKDIDEARSGIERQMKELNLMLTTPNT
ncbi:hypothetical protein [Candidatus Ichthyocystis sparus]|uniref:hypothetical protein n=1 Tax=Candidatus Ichthyocystis sparus TaxID=1561004 RepID=UPI0011471D0A|nr:hypothetical protein [Candidatus Ichthyocystis sparus]